MMRNTETEGVKLLDVAEVTGTSVVSNNGRRTGPGPISGWTGFVVVVVVVFRLPHGCDCFDTSYAVFMLHLHLHLSLNRRDPLFLFVLHCPLGLLELQACPLPDVVFPPLSLSALSSSPFHCALHDGFSQTWWTGGMSTPLQFVSLYDDQEVLPAVLHAVFIRLYVPTS